MLPRVKRGRADVGSAAIQPIRGVAAPGRWLGQAALRARVADREGWFSEGSGIGLPGDQEA